MIADEQTQTLPEDVEAVERFARFLGYDSRAAFANDLLAHLNCVQGHYSKLFEADQVVDTSALPPVDYAAGPEDQRLAEHLIALGFKKPAMVAETLRQWMAAEYRVLRVDSTRRAFLEFVPSLIEGLGRAEQPDNAVIAFDRLLQALHRGGRLVSLLSQNKELVVLVALVLSAAPRLGDMVARQPQIMDGLIDPRFFGAMPDRRELSARLAATLSDAGSYEEFLDRLRVFGQESLFLIGTRILSGTVSTQQASIAFADVGPGHRRHGAPAGHRSVRAQYGRIKGQETAIVAMGRLGSREMTAASDLDLILIYDFDHEQPDSDGPRSLQGAHYFARFTQRLISAFTTRTNYGVLYEIDMRLRPSGRAGPLASRLDSFAEYQDHEAWTWEHMALTRARVISASPEFRAKIEAIIREILTRPRDTSVIARDVVEMRHAIAQEKGEDDIWDLKYAAGGLIDIDFIAQYLQLVHAAAMPDILSVGTLLGARQCGAARRAAERGRRIAAQRGAALSRPHADHPALRQRKIQPRDRGRGSAARAGPRRRRAGLLLAGSAGEGNPGRGARGVRRGAGGRQLVARRPPPAPATSPSQPASADQIAAAGHDQRRDRVPGHDEQRAVVGAVGGVEGRGDPAGGEAGDGAGEAGIGRRALTQRQQQAGERADRQQRNQQQAVDRVAADQFGQPLRFRQHRQFDDDGDGEQRRRDRQRQPLGGQRRAGTAKRASRPRWR